MHIYVGSSLLYKKKYTAQYKSIDKLSSKNHITENVQKGKPGKKHTQPKTYIGTLYIYEYNNTYIYIYPIFRWRKK